MFEVELVKKLEVHCRLELSSICCVYSIDLPCLLKCRFVASKGHVLGTVLFADEKRCRERKREVHFLREVDGQREKSRDGRKSWFGSNRFDVEVSAVRRVDSAEDDRERQNESREKCLQPA